MQLRASFEVSKGMAHFVTIMDDHESRGTEKEIDPVPKQIK